MSRRFQFSLRAFLMAMTVPSAVLAWVFVPLFELRQQQQIASDLRKRGMGVEYEYNPLHSPIPPGPAWARWLYGDSLFVDPVAITWRGAPPADDDLRLLSKLRHLKRLSLAGVPINDAYLDKLARLKTLEELDLRATPITDDGLAHFPFIPKLKRLFLAKTSVSCGGIEKLRRRIGHMATLSISW